MIRIAVFKSRPCKGASRTLVGIGLLAILAGSPCTAQEKVWCWYYQDECIERPLEQAYLAVITDSETPSEEVVDYLAGSNLGTWALEYSGGGFHRFWRTQAVVSTEAIVETLSQQPDQSWLWSPVFCGGGILITPLKEILLRVNDGYSQADLELVLLEEQAGTIIQGPTSSGRYRVETTATSGFAVVDTANRLHVREEIDYAEPNQFWTSCGPDGPCQPLCPVLGPNVAAPIPTASVGALLVMTLFILCFAVRRLS